MNAWSVPLEGVSHKDGKGREWRATVTDYGSFAELTCWYPGCSHSPLQSVHPTAQEAKEVGDAWLGDPVTAEDRAGAASPTPQTPQV